MIKFNLLRAKQLLQQWEIKNKQTIQEYQSCKEINQPLILPDSFLHSQQLIFHKIKKMKCQICHYKGKYKYIRSKSMLQESKCLVFLLCENCYQIQNSSLPIQLDKSCYLPMHTFIETAQNGIKNFQRQAKYSQKIVKKYYLFESRLANVIRQLIKTVEKRRELVCRKIFQEISTLRQIFLKNHCQQIYQTILKSCPCNCKSQCCYCDYKDENQEFMKVNCEFYQLKRQQNDIITKIDLLNSVKCTFDGIKEDNVFAGIIREVEIVVLKYMQEIEKSLNSVTSQTAHISLLNTQFMERINENYSEMKMQDSEMLVQQRKTQYIQMGVLNHLTEDSFNNFSDEITSISLNYMPEKKMFRSKLKGLNKLNKIDIGCSQIGALLIQDTIKSSNDQINLPKVPLEVKLQNKIQKKEAILGKRIEDIANNAQNVVNLNHFNQLKTISFNCQTTRIQEFLDSIASHPSIQQLHFNWNFAEFFEKFNQSTHFLQDNILYNTSPPQIIKIKSLYERNKLKNIWIGSCGKFDCDEENTTKTLQVEEYHNIVVMMGKKIQGVMFGDFDGRLRHIQIKLYQQLISKNSLQTLFFNKIQFEEKMIAALIKNNQQLKALYFNQCQGFSQYLFLQIQGLLFLKKLSIVQIRTIYFKKSISTLTTFILQRCFGLIGPEVVTVIKEAKLSCLSLYQCRFIDDMTIRQIISQQIKNQSKLNYINLGYTKITNQTLNLLSFFPTLRSLHIGGTHLNLSHLLVDIFRQKLANLKGLEKLSLKQMKEIELKEQSKTLIPNQHYNDLFSYILEYFPILSYLDLSGNKVINERAIRFGLTHLTYLKVTDTLYSENNQNRRIDHSGFDCPFIEGRLGMGENTPIIMSQQPKIHVQQNQAKYALKVIF